MNYELKILDTTDSYVLTFIGNGLNKDKVLPTYEALYNEIGITINVVDTPYNILSEDTVSFIRSTCGSIIPTTLPFCSKTNGNIKDCESVLDKLTKDIATVVDFNRIQRFWKSYSNHNPFQQSDVKVVNGWVVNGFTSPSVDTCDNICSENQIVSGSNLSDIFKVKLLPEDHVAKSSRAKENVTYILWNNTYSIAIVYEDKHDVILQIDRNKGEWEIVHTLTPTSFDIIGMCNSVFHRKTFESIHAVRDKVGYLKNFLSVNEQTESLTNNSTIQKNNLLSYIQKNYDISNDNNQKIRATDVYKSLCNNFHIDYTNEATFKKKLIGHLLELGVVKKRFSDGYYFCGITQRATS
jgi:hypothetical protein